MDKKELILYFIFSIFSLTLLFVIINFLQLKDYTAFLWACYICLPIIIYGILKRDSNIILSQIIIIAIPDLFWIFDFIYLLITGHVLLGVTTFKGSPIDKIRSLQHLILVPLSILALSQIKIKKNYKILLISLAEIVLIFFISALFAPISANINCVYKNCILIPINFLPYPLIWFGLLFTFIAISYFVIISLPFVKKSSNLRKFRKRS